MIDKVAIEYLEIGAVSPDVYFDRSETPEFAYAHDFLRIDPLRLCWTLLEVSGDEPYSIRTQYLRLDGNGTLDPQAEGSSPSALTTQAA